ncbi:MAG: hypothetical protein AAB870_03000 [Patescibacteria group bacterium]
MKTTITNALRTALIATVLTVGFGVLPVTMANAFVCPDGSNQASSLNCIPATPPGAIDRAITPYGTIVAIINFVLGFLGIIAVVIILIAGFKWMTAGGNDDNVKAAQTMLIQGVIGLVIILSAWGIAQWAFTLPGTIVK